MADTTLNTLIHWQRTLDQARGINTVLRWWIDLPDLDRAEHRLNHTEQYQQYQNIFKFTQQ
jgi:hypothetical protein